MNKEEINFLDEIAGNRAFNNVEKIQD